jgi:hypothetical protein
MPLGFLLLTGKLQLTWNLKPGIAYPHGGLRHPQYAGARPGIIGKARGPGSRRRLVYPGVHYPPSADFSVESISFI